MTRCKEFYEKVKKDGNFCGMSDKAYRDLNHYSEEVEKDETGKPVLSEGAWIKQRKEQAASHKLVEAEKPERKDSVVKEYEFAKEVNNFIQWCFTQRKEEVIREVIDKAIVNSR